jgi:hypothetical protein
MVTQAGWSRGTLVHLRSLWSGVASVIESAILTVVVVDDDAQWNHLVVIKLGHLRHRTGRHPSGRYPNSSYGLPKILTLRDMAILENKFQATDEQEGGKEGDVRGETDSELLV